MSFAIRVIPQFHPSTINPSSPDWLWIDETGPSIFETEKEAQDALDRYEAERGDEEYHLSYGEYARPVYEVRRYGRPTG